MANEEHLKILSKGMASFNGWRMRNPSILPDFSNANLAGKYLAGAKFQDAIFSGAVLREANLIEAEFDRASLSKANLAKANLQAARFPHANMSGAILVEANLSKVNLVGANLNGAFLERANFYMADLENAQLINADLSRARFEWSFLINANLESASLVHADFIMTDLTGANLARAVVSLTRFMETNFHNATALEHVQHLNRSSIGIDTLYISGGSIPDSFLRGCGVPDSLIDYLPSLLSAIEPLQFYSCFISCSHNDEDFAKRLHQRLRSEHLRVWFAPNDIQAGRKVLAQIDDAIRMHDKTLLVLSKHSLNSKWVTTELRKACKAELHNGQQKLFPIRLVDMEELQGWECIDVDTGEDLAHYIRSYYIPDFSNWNDHDAFEESFANLLRDLRASDKRKDGGAH